MPTEYQHETLQAALIAGGYADAAAKVAGVAARRGLGAETTVNLISQIDGPAARIAEQIFADQGQHAPAVARTPEQTEASAHNWLDNLLLEGTGRGPIGGGEE
jgi:hypothetical protein